MKKTFKKRLALWIPLSVLFALIAFVIIVGHVPSGFVSGKVPETKYNDVMKRAYEENPNFGDMPATRIAVLGSHDALSYNINYGSEPNSSEDNMVNKAWLRAVGKGALVRYSRAQMHDVYTQLNYGVRYIDVRITNIDGVYYNSHNLVSHKLEDSLRQILRFLSENSGEYIIFHIVHYYEGESDFAGLCEYFESVKYEGKCLYDYVNYDTAAVNSHGELTYNMLTENGTKAGVILLSDSVSQNEYYDYFKLDRAVSKWHNITNSDKLKQAVENYYETAAENPERIVVNQAQTTPKGDDVWGVFVGWSLLDMAAKHNLNMLSSENFSDWFKRMPVYMCDFATSTKGGFNTKVNEKILEHNLALL